MSFKPRAKQISSLERAPSFYKPTKIRDVLGVKMTEKTFPEN